MRKSNGKRIVIALAIFGLAAAGAVQAQDANPFLGAWKGKISIAGQELEIGLNFQLDEAKKITGTFDSISQGAFGLALSAIEIKDKTITFMLSGVPGDPSFKGTLDGAGKKLAGDFTQGGYAGTFAVDKQ
jgi:hypothetical protein